MPASSLTLPPPVGGWNRKDALAFMDPSDAVELVNYFPGESDVSLRKGYAAHVSTGMGSDSVDTLISYNTNDGSSKLLACTNGNIYDVTSSTPSSLKSGRILDYVNWIQYKDKVIICNAVEQPLQYDGSTISDANYTGIANDNLLATVNVYKERLYFGQIHSTKIWYGAAGAVTGELTEFDVGDVIRKGGRIRYAGSWSRDTGAGLEDHFVIATSEGEILIYQGDYPEAANWSLAARLETAEPLGWRSFHNAGSDLIVGTTEGISTLHQMVAASQTDRGFQRMSDKIEDAFRQAARNQTSETYWQIIHYPKGGYILVNIPLSSNSNYEQYVMNTQTGAWARFVGMDAASWAVSGRDLYFGTTDGKVMKADTGNNDNNARIDGKCSWAFNYFGDRARLKKFTLAKPIIIGSQATQFDYGLNVDFRFQPIDTSITSDGTDGAPWDTSSWDTASWSQEDAYLDETYSLCGHGHAASLQLAGSFKDAPHRIVATQIQFEAGGFV